MEVGKGMMTGESHPNFGPLEDQLKSPNMEIWSKTNLTSPKPNHVAVHLKFLYIHLESVLYHLHLQVM